LDLAGRILAELREQLLVELLPQFIANSGIRWNLHAILAARDLP
jgi:hypothetical protein